jgi:hypothetical protein
MKLKELGYRSPHPWRRSIKNSVESAFGGLLLALLPNLIDLDFWIKDHQRGPPSSECISGLWGGTSPPATVLRGWKNISHLITGDTSVLKCGIELDKLTSLDLRTISIGTVLRLNGPGSLQGAENLKDLTLTVSIQFADRPLVTKAEIEFSELLEALGCRALKNLKILFINDGYHIGDDLTTELNAGYFLSQLHTLHKTLETLSITLETADDDGELEWLVDMCQQPSRSLKCFTILRSLVLPQPFLFTARSTNWNTEDACHPRDLPPNLERLELLYPHEDVEEWAEGFLDEYYYDNESDTAVQPEEPAKRNDKFKKLTLTCREDVGIGATYFTEGVEKIWWDLSTDFGIESEVHDQLRDTRQNLAVLFQDEILTRAHAEDDDEFDDQDEIDEDGWDDGVNNIAISEGLLEQAQILKFLREIPNPSEGRTVAQISKSVNLDMEKVLIAARYLIECGNLRSIDSPDGEQRIVFSIANEELLRQDRLLESTTENGIDADNSDKSMPELETFEPELGGDAGMEMPQFLQAQLIARTNVLRCLRDMPNPSQGLTYAELASQLGIYYAQVQVASYDLVDAGHVRYDGDRLYSLSEDSSLRAEDVD